MLKCSMFTVYQITISSAEIGHYVGCSQRFIARTNEHRSRLSKGLHACFPLQSAYNSGGSFSVSAIETGLSKRQATERETYWINLLRLKGEIVFNRRIDAASNAGVSHTELTKDRISKSLAGRSTRSQAAIEASAAKMRGRRKPKHVIADSQAGLKEWRSEQANIDCVAKQQAKLSDDTVRIIRSSDLTYKELGSMFGVSPAVICGIRNGRKYRWVSY